MVLGDKILRERQIVTGENVHYSPSSIDLRLGNTWSIPKETERTVELGKSVEYETVTSDYFCIQPGQFLLATTQERVDLPADVSGFIQGRSSIGRIGLTVQNAGYVDPGFRGEITLELVNESPNRILLTKGYRVAQLVCIETKGVEHAYEGKYNDQVGATGSRMELDPEAK